MGTKRAYRGDTSKSTALGAAPANGAASKQPAKKKRRGPKAFIDLPRGNIADGASRARAGNDSDDDENMIDEDEEIQAALEAEEMAVGAYEDDSDDDEQPKAKGKTKKSAADVGFLLKLDDKGIAKSRAEIKRLAKAERDAERSDRNRAARQRALRDEEQAQDSDDASTDMGSGLSAADLSELEFDSELDDLSESEPEQEEAARKPRKAARKEEDDMDVEAEHAARLRVKSKRQAAEQAAISAENAKRRLPVRAADGWAEASEASEDEDADSAAEAEAGPSTKPNGKVAPKSRAVHAPVESDDEEEFDDRAARAAAAQPTSTFLTGARFGLLAPYAILGLPKRSARVAAAREQIARLATDVVADPEASLGMLKRLAVFAGRSISPPEHEREQEEAKGNGKREIDEAIRAAAIMSLCAVFVDIVPGYRIRPLSEAEKQEKTNQETARRREWEQGLVDTYRGFLETCDKILRAKITLSVVALRSMCLLLTRAPHFNYRTNLIRALVSQLSRKGWGADSALCASTLTDLLRNDHAGDVSLEVVRLLNRMIKERSYRVNARVLDLLLHLRLRDELGNRRGDTRTVDRKEKDGATKYQQKVGKDKAKPGEVRKGLGKHLSKTDIKKMKERKEIEAEMKEADAEIDVEERERNQTETLKLLFVLYFSILKAPSVPGPLLASALEGLARIAHRINVDFFRDLLGVLRKHVVEARRIAESSPVSAMGAVGDENDEDSEAEDSEDEQEDGGKRGVGAAAVKSRSQRRNGMREALLCLVTAFELLSGQGEALNIDLADMAAHLYAVMLPLSVSPTIEDPPTLLSGGAAPTEAAAGKAKGKDTHLLRTDADSLLRAIELALLRPRAGTLSSERTAAFAKRAMTCALQLPPHTACRMLGIVKACVARDTRLEALLDTQDRAKDGRFDASSDDVDAARPLGAGEAAWELHLLLRSSNSDVAAEARKLLAWQR